MLEQEVESARICENLMLCDDDILTQQASLPTSELQIQRRLTLMKISHIVLLIVLGMMTVVLCATWSLSKCCPC